MQKWLSYSFGVCFGCFVLYALKPKLHKSSESKASVLAVQWHAYIMKKIREDMDLQLCQAPIKTYNSKAIQTITEICKNSVVMQVVGDIF